MTPLLESKDLEGLLGYLKKNYTADQIIPSFPVPIAMQEK